MNREDLVNILLAGNDGEKNVEDAPVVNEVEGFDLVSPGFWGFRTKKVSLPLNEDLNPLSNENPPHSRDIVEIPIVIKDQLSLPAPQKVFTYPPGTSLPVETITDNSHLSRSLKESLLVFSGKSQDDYVIPISSIRFQNVTTREKKGKKGEIKDLIPLSWFL